MEPKGRVGREKAHSSVGEKS